MDDPFVEYHRSRFGHAARVLRWVAVGAVLTVAGFFGLVLSFISAFGVWFGGFAVGVMLVLGATVIAARIAIGEDTARALGKWRLAGMALLLVPSYPLVGYGIEVIRIHLSLNLLSGGAVVAGLFAVYLAVWSRVADRASDGSAEAA